jgi:hypothetical protein
MKNQVDKNFFKKLKNLFENAKNYLQDDNKNSFSIQNYCVNTIFAEYKKNKEALNDLEKKEFELLIKDLAATKKSIGEDSNNTKEEYIAFLEGAFAAVDDIDRNGEVTNNLSVQFKFLSEIIDVLQTWGELPEEWMKKSNF